MKNIWDLIDKVSKIYNEYELDFAASNLTKEDYQQQLKDFKLKYPEANQIKVNYYQPELYETDDLLPKLEFEKQEIWVDLESGKLINETPLWFKKLNSFTVKEK